MKRPAITLFVCLFVLFNLTTQSFAVWDETGNLIGTSNYNSYPLHMISDGDGGAIICWKDEMTPGVYGLYIQKIDGLGRIQWTENGVTVFDSSIISSSFNIASDGDGGAIVTCLDWRDGVSNDVYAQRIDAYGNPVWATGGVILCNEGTYQSAPVIVADGTGGAIIAWVDDRNGAGNDIYAQHIDASGNVSWTTDGIEVCTYSGDQDEPVITTDGQGGAIVVWLDGRTFGVTEIYAQRIASDGSLEWSSIGRPVSLYSSVKNDLDIVSDGMGGAYIVWVDERSGDSDVYLQHISSYGGRELEYEGEPICVEVEDQNSARLVADEDHGAIIFWADERDGSKIDIYAQRINYEGDLQWVANGTGVCTSGDDKYYPAPVSDGTGGAIVVWSDYRYSHMDLRAARIDASGSLLWDSDGVVLVDTWDTQYLPSAVSDGEGGAITAFHDDRNHVIYNDIYAQRVDRFGNWGYPSPDIASVTDVPLDQGGYVSIDWDACRFDPWPYEDVDEYKVWRAVDQASANLLLSRSEGPEIDTRIRIEVTAGGTWYWEHMYTVEATHLEHYSKVVETRFDSSFVTRENHYFQVSAHGVDPSEYWISAIDSCRSVDNLAPAAPLGLVGEQSFLPAGIELTWLPCDESDLSMYVVYRGLHPGFVTHPANLVATTADAALFDDEWDWSAGFCYKVGAVDIHDNVGEYALFAPGELTDSDSPSAPRATSLEQNYPNPFNPATTIRFGLRSAGPVSLKIFDPAGRLVRVLVDERRTASVYNEIWNGLDNGGSRVSSGMYFYRLLAGEFEETKKMILLR